MTESVQSTLDSAIAAALERVSRTEVLVLGAGASRRLGELKQLVRFRGETLIRRAVKVALGTGSSAVSVIVGASADAVEQALSGLPVRVIRNHEWARGMGSSLRAGARAIVGDSRVAGVIVMTCDQPSVTSRHLRELVRLASLQGLAASEYEGCIGVPAFFASAWLPALALVPDHEGARGLLEREEPFVSRVALQRGAFDVDSPSDLSLLQSEALVTEALGRIE